MANPKKVHCLFEQSGTFKNEFIKLGIPAEDYDILNDFGQTDNVIDLYSEIETAYQGGQCVFDNIAKDDLIMCFFPCVRFENQIMLAFRGQSHGMEEWTYKQKMLNDIRLQKELTHNYELVNKLFIVCIDRGLKLIMENPFSDEHYLRRYWCLAPSIIDKDRREKGDYYKKPTQYWFLNCKPKNNLVFEVMNYNAIECGDAIRKIKKSDIEHTGARTIKVARSMIHPDYANRFIKENIIDYETNFNFN